MKGVFITFEGPDGAGKSTQIRKFAAYLEAHGHQVQLTREPGGTPLGDRVRKVVLDPAAGVVDDRTETLLYLASRAQHVAELIVPALSAGKVVVCDRFSDSTLAYQGIARGLGLEKMSQLNEFATGGLQPDLTFLLDGNPAELAGRRSRRQGRSHRRSPHLRSPARPRYGRRRNDPLVHACPQTHEESPPHCQER